MVRILGFLYLGRRCLRTWGSTGFSIVTTPLALPHVKTCRMIWRNLVARAWRSFQCGVSTSAISSEVRLFSREFPIFGRIWLPRRPIRRSLSFLASPLTELQQSGLPIARTLVLQETFWIVPLRLCFSALASNRADLSRPQ